MKKVFGIAFIALMMLPVNMEANVSEKKAKVKVETIDYVKRIISEQLQETSAIDLPNEKIELEIAIDEDGELKVIGMRGANKKQRRKIAKKVEQLVFPGIEEIHGKIVTCDLKFRKI
ncbi:MAG: hypothetical protein AAF487_05540 [Bacteroidota bacterium]